VFVFGLHMVATACNSVLRLRSGLGRLEQAGACTSLWRLASWRSMGNFFKEGELSEGGGGYTGDDREDVLGRPEEIFCRKQT
jgi:hypothetical protein